MWFTHQEVAKGPRTDQHGHDYREFPIPKDGAHDDRHEAEEAAGTYTVEDGKEYQKPEGRRERPQGDRGESEDSEGEEHAVYRAQEGICAEAHADTPDAGGEVPARENRSPCLLRKADGRDEKWEQEGGYEEWKGRDRTHYEHEHELQTPEQAPAFYMLAILSALEWNELRRGDVCTIARATKLVGGRGVL